MSTPTFEPDVFVDVSREQYLVWLAAGKPSSGPNALPAGAIPISAAGLNRLGQALQVASEVAGAAATAEALASAQTLLQTGINAKATPAQAQSIAQAAIAAFVGSAPAELDTWPEVVAYLANLAATDSSVAGQLTTLTQQIAAKYTKPAGGIPAADLAAGVVPDISTLLTKTDAAATYRQVVAVDRAFGDGTTDAAAHIQSRLAAAAAAGGGTVFLPRGTYRCTQMLTIPDKVNLVGEGDRSTVDVSGVAMLTAILAQSTTGTTLRDFRILGSGQGAQPANTAGQVDVASTGSGVVLAGCTGARVENLTVDSCGGTTGVAPYNGVAAIWLTYGCRDCVITGNKVLNSRNGINEDDFFGATPRGNKITANTVSGCRFGIALDNGGTDTETVVSNNTVRASQQSGIDLNRSRRVRVVGNYVEQAGLENGNAGIAVYGTTSVNALNNVLDGNVIQAPTGQGIKVGANASLTSVTGNVIVQSGKEGILVTGTSRYFDLVGNNINSATLDGIKVDASATGLVSANHVRDSQQNGINIITGLEMTVTGNVIKQASLATANTYDGIRLGSNTTNCIFSANLITGSANRYGIVAGDSGSQKNTFVGNRIAAGQTGRMGFGNLDQIWADNDDTYVTAAGAPTGAYPQGSTVYNNGDQRLYVRGSAGWRYATTTAV